MRMKKWFKGISVLAMMLMLVLSSSVTAFAYVDESQAASDVVIEEEFKGEEKVGDQVIYSKYSGTEVKLDEDEYIIVKQNDILAVIE